jgi:hypothetical protein
VALGSAPPASDGAFHVMATGQIESAEVGASRVELGAVTHDTRLARDLRKATVGLLPPPPLPQTYHLLGHTC